ncbi:MAG TPA: DUF5686 family protein, partial [Bacteroidia bacterium]|nr:DUF5686 family protein [Bacteroidia bacterium]
MRKTLLFLLLLVSPFSLLAGIVKGTIRDTTGQPIPYVVVGVKNSSYGVNSNLAGGYFIELKAGNYTLVFSQIGLQPQEHAVTITDDKPLILNVTMKTATKELSTFEVKATGDRQMGKEIMHHVIDARSDYWNRVQNYQCNTYQKSSLEKFAIEKKRDSIPGLKVAPPPPKDTTATKKKKGGKADNLEEAIKDKKLNLIESVTETYFRSPNAFKENILAYHDYAESKHYEGKGYSKTVDYGEHEIAPVEYSAENAYLLITDAQSMDFNFYKNEINAPSLCSRPLLSPAAATAFLSYKFDLIDSIEENGKIIYKISVSPLFRSDALFSGLLFIQKDTWAIVSVNLCVNPDVLLFAKEFCVIID